MQRVILFAKSPRRGAVKTRLVPPLSEQQALELHDAMLGDQIDFIRTLAHTDRSVEVCLDHPMALGDIPSTLQGRGDLGARLSTSFDRAFASGCTEVAVIGADAPTLPRALVDQILTRVAGDPAVAIVPALDGGYVAIALSAPAPQLFDRVPWGTSEVLATTWSRASGAKLRMEITGTWGDVDTAGDLPRLRAECAADPRRAPRTASVLSRLAVI